MSERRNRPQIDGKVDLFPNTLRAVTIGSRALKTLGGGGFEGTVHSVFERVVNVISEEEEMVCLTRGDVSNASTNIVTDLSSSFTFLSSPLREGVKVAGNGTWIWIDKLLVIYLEGARVWEANRPIQTDLRPKEILRNLKRAGDAAMRYGSQEGLGGLIDRVDDLIRGETPNLQELNTFSRYAFPNVASLIKAILDDNLPLVQRLALKIVGLGPGLTPSGDDLLGGFMCSLRLVLESLEGDRRHADRVCEAVTSLLDGRTTLIGRKFLEYAASGDVDERTFNLVETLLSKTEKEVVEAVGALVSRRHPSSTDVILGVILGTRVGLIML